MAKPFLQCHHRFKNGKDHCYWSIAEKVRTHRGWGQRPLLYLGEINDRQKAAWTKVSEVFDTSRQQTRELALYPTDRAVPEHAAEYGVQVRLGEFELRRPRQWGACWAGCPLWDQLQLDEFWRERLPDSREGTAGRQVLQTLTIYRLIDPGSEWRLHREWFKNSALADLLAEDFSLAQKDTQSANRPAVARNWLKYTNWPRGVTGAWGSHSTCIRRPCRSSASRSVRSTVAVAAAIGAGGSFNSPSG